MIKIIKPQIFNKGFTLIELLIVVVIIGILATLATVSLNSVRTKARDVKRVADIRAINMALQLYYDQEGHYPINYGATTEFVVGQPLASQTTGAVFMTAIPSNPMPRNEGSSNNPTNLDYVYTSDAGGSTYTLKFWLASDVSSTKAGENYSLPNIPICTPSCDGLHCNNHCGGVCVTCDSIYDECTSANVLGDRCGGGYLYYKSPNLVAVTAGCRVDAGVYSCPVGIDDGSYYWKYPPVSATFGTSDENDGRNNAANLPNTSVEAGNFCNNMSLYGFDDFYVPAIYELTKMYDNRVKVNSALNFGGIYWSSTQWNSNSLNAVAYSFIASSGNCYDFVRYNCDSKDGRYHVRCIRRANF